MSRVSVTFPTYATVGTYADNREGNILAHRAGWPVIRQALSVLTAPTPLHFDDFTERTFFYPDGPPTTCTQPWIGIFHHPASVPSYAAGQRVSDILSNSHFRASQPHIKGAITMATDVAVELGRLLHVPILCTPHPTGFEFPQFRFEDWAAAPQVAHVGWFLRNQDLLFQTELPSGYRALLVKSPGAHNHDDWAQQKQRRGHVPPQALKRPSNIPVRRHATTQPALDAAILVNRPIRNPFVERLGPLTPAEYDTLLARSVVAVEFHACAASSTLMDCVARATPILVNPLPSVVEYLGPDYPLYFTHPNEFRSLLQPQRVHDAHIYLTKLNRERFSISLFVEKIQGFVDLVMSGQW